ncbi:MAG: hypothetical protein PHS36_08855 [Candidatus Cloacimonetes bacterium]|nr:hypothetical protein [Candidatus Cloacimonadota bacterium]
MAIAKAGQKAYNDLGEEATLTKEFLSKDFSTWDEGLVSINHENNHDWVKATLYNPEYDNDTDLVICSFSGLPDWVKSLIYSDDYQGLSQECLPVKFAKNSNDVIRGFGTGVTIVTSPYSPAADQGMGVGIRPVLAAILASKYPNNHPKEDSMTEPKGGGVSAISIEAFESTVSENVQLKSTIKVLETEKAKLEKELDSWKQKYTDLESGEADRVKIAISEARNSWDSELKAKAEREAAVSELKTVMSSEAYESYLATNPTVEQIKSIAGIMKVNTSKGVGISNNASPAPEGKSYEELNSMWNAKLGRA